MHHLSSATLLLSSLAAAQVQTIVSPTIATTAEGSSSNAFPWTSVSNKRYTQIHSDIGGSPKLISKIAGRMNGTVSAFAGTRALDLELYMGDSVPYNACSFVIPNNYVGTRTLVTTRQVVNCGPFSAGSPAPFAFAIPLTTPFVYTGVHSLLWEMLLYGNAVSGSAPASTDTELCSITAAVTTSVGTGCTATGQTSAMLLSLGASDVAGTFTMGWYVDRAPANAQTILYVGGSNPNLTIPGLCGVVYTDLLLALPLGTSDGTGFVGSLVGTSKIAGGPCTLVLPNTFPGAAIYTQAHSLDLGSTFPLKIANSQGVSFTVPAPSTTRIAKLSRIYSNDTQTAVNAHYFNTLSVGYGAPVEFTY